MLGDISDGIERVCWGIYQMVSSVCVCVCVCVCGGRGAEDVSEGIEGMSEGVRETCYVREKMLCEGEDAYHQSPRGHSRHWPRLPKNPYSHAPPLSLSLRLSLSLSLTPSQVNQVIHSASSPRKIVRFYRFFCPWIAVSAVNSKDAL